MSSRLAQAGGALGRSEASLAGPSQHLPEGRPWIETAGRGVVHTDSHTPSPSAQLCAVTARLVALVRPRVCPPLASVCSFSRLWASQAGLASRSRVTPVWVLGLEQGFLCWALGCPAEGRSEDFLWGPSLPHCPPGLFGNLLGAGRGGPGCRLWVSPCRLVTTGAMRRDGGGYPGCLLILLGAPKPA